MARSPQLESFDLYDDPSTHTFEEEPSVEWSLGHAAGMAEGVALANAVQQNLSTEIAQCFADMGFGYAEARLQLLQSLKPLFGALLNRVLPGLATSALVVQVVELLNQVAEQDCRTPLELSVHPSRIESLTGLLPYAVGMQVILIADPEIGPDQAVLRARQSETLLDVAAVLDGVQTALGAIFESEVEKVNYG